MIKFFRKIRKKLFIESRFSKYLLYALGEIILVVIGIMIALQINNWNEGKKNDLVEKSYLKGIRNNLNQDIYDLNIIIEKDTIKLKSYTLLLNAFKDKSIQKYGSNFIYAIGQSYITHTFTGNSILFEDMKSSGKINFIKSNILRISLLEYYSESQINTRYQNEKYITEYNTLKQEAFHDNIDLNSLIEEFMFEGKLKAPIDALDLSFFDTDPKSKAVKSFVNRISVLKVLMQNNHRKNNELLFKANKLKEKIDLYLDTGILNNDDYIFKELLTAIKKGNIKLLKQNINTTNVNKCFETEFEKSSYLDIAINENAIESINYILKQGADVNKVCENKTPLMYASKYGLLEICELLINKGADINYVSIKGKTALDYAIQYKQPKIIEYLEKRQAKRVMTLKND